VAKHAAARLTFGTLQVLVLVRCYDILCAYATFQLVVDLQQQQVGSSLYAATQQATLVQQL
jgi:hypothetical protein